MRTKFFFFAMLISVAASATVTVTPISTDYSAKKVTFKVAWTNSPTAPYNNRVWVWVDLCPVTGTIPATSFSTATISSPAKTGGNGTVTNATARGFFIEYGATNAGTTVTATLSNATGEFNWCAYGSDYPPNVLANTNGSYTLAGTPPFTLIASNGTTVQTGNGKTIATAAVTITPATITDATGYPGLWCPYTGSDLYMDATHRCRERQSGAYNWEAWIKDTRDNQIYRITQFTDNSWWFADNLSFQEKVIAICSGVTQYYGSNHPDCPTGWQIPIIADLNKRWIDYDHVVNDQYGGSFNSNILYVGARCYGGPVWNKCTTPSELGTGNFIGAVVRDLTGVSVMTHNGTFWSYHCNDKEHESNHSGVMRCFR
jgi:uncharacterized protein (TIGR02145 family)